MAFGKLIGLAAIGGLLYAHKRNGGQFTAESFSKSARDLMDLAKTRARDFKSVAEDRLQQTAGRIEGGPAGSASPTQRGYDFGSVPPGKAH